MILITIWKKTLSKINKKNKEVYITGDFNIDFLKYEIVPKYKDFYNMMASNGYLPQITMATRLTDTTMSIIDNIYTNTFTEDIFGGNIILQVADHLLQFISVNKKHTVNHVKSNYYKRDYKMFNEQDFLNDLSANDWDNNITDTNAKYNIFMWDLEHYANKHAPLKKVNKRKQKIMTKPWISDQILKKIKHRNKLFAKKKNNPEDAYTKSVYNKFRNSVNKDIRSSKKEYYQSYFENCKNDMKKTWKGIRCIVNTKKTNLMNTSQIISNNKLIDNPKEISNTFNNFFINIGSNTEKTIPKSGKCPTAYLKNRINTDFIIAHTSNDELMKIILLLDEKKSTGPSSIPVKLLKIALPVIINPLCKLVNHSFITGIFPDAVKISKVIPIFKAGSTQDEC